MTLLRFFVPLSLTAATVAMLLLMAGSPLAVSGQTCSGLPTKQNPNKRKKLSRADLSDRHYYIFTPDSYDSTQPNKVVLMFHGWGGNGGIYIMGGWKEFANIHGYVLVAPDGLNGGGSTKNTWRFPGSSDGIGQDGVTVTTCNTGQTRPDYCYDRSCPCNNRCGWTHCEDDDFQFVIDLIAELDNHVCVDSARVYAAGVSNGGMFSWSLGQNESTAPLLAGIGPIIGLPHHDYRLGKAKMGALPVIGVSGSEDCTNPPGDGTQNFTESCDGDGYYMVDADRLHATWASDHGCDVSQSYTYIVPERPEVACATYCDPQVSTPASVDCRADMGHSSPTWTLDVVLKFFEDHAGELGGPPSPTPPNTPAPSSQSPTSCPPSPPSGNCASNTKPSQCKADCNCEWSQGSCIDRDRR